MKKLLIFLLFLSFSHAENVTDAFGIRNANTGIPINLNRKSKQFNDQNWLLNELGSDEKISKKDRLAKAFPFGYVQFENMAQRGKCMQIASDGLLSLKDCKKDYESGEFETIFSLIPTTSGAMQIRSLVLKADECLGTFENPNINIVDRVGLVRCVLEFFVHIPAKQLFNFSPPLSQARLVR